MESLNFVDIILLVIFFISVVVGFSRGFIGELLALATIVVALLVAINFAVPLADVFTTHPAIQSVVKQASSHSAAVEQSASYFSIALSFALLFIGVLIIGAIVRFILNLALQTSVIGLGNRFLGACFGAIRGYLLNLVLVFIITLTPFVSQQWWQQSYFVRMYQPQVQWLASMVSPTLSNLKSHMDTTIKNVTSQIQNMIEKIAS